MITSAAYIKDENGAVMAIRVVYDGTEMDAPLNGTNWLSRELKEWIAAGGVIAGS